MCLTGDLLEVAGSMAGMVNCALCETDASVAPLEVGGWNFAVHAPVRFQCGHFVHEACWGRYLLRDLSKSLTCPTCTAALFTPGDMPTFDASWQLQEDCLCVSSEPLAGLNTYVAAVEDLRVDIGVKPQQSSADCLMVRHYCTFPNWDRVHVLVKAAPTGDILAVSSTMWWRGQVRCTTPSADA